MSLLHDIAKGAVWTTGAQWVVQFTQFLVSIVLARLLLPSDYGLVGLAIVYMGFITIFSSLGMGPALIQRKNIDDDYISTAFWATATVSLLLFAASIVGAPYIAGFFREPRLIDIIRVAAIALLLTPLNSVLASLLTRHMQFRSLAIVEVTSAVLSQGAALIGAVSGLGVWALVVAQLIAPLARLPLLFRFNRWLPSFRFDPGRFADLVSFSSPIVGFNIINYFSRNSDKIIIGKLLGPAQLGFYDISYQLMLKPLHHVSNTISTPLFPALSSIQDDKSEVGHLYRRVVTYIALITFPMMLGLAAVADDFVHAVLGAKWAPAIPVLQILCLVGAMQSVGTTVGDIYLSQGRSDLMIKWTLVATPITVTAFYLGSNWGIVGVATCYAAVSVPLWFAQHYIANRLIGLPLARFWGALLPAAYNSIVMLAGVYSAQRLCDLGGCGRMPRLIVAITTGVVVYGVLAQVSHNPDISAVRDRAYEKLHQIRECLVA